MSENMSRKDKITKAQFDIIQTTGKISGEVKDILTYEDRNKIIECIGNVNENLKELISGIRDLSEALNLDFNKIIGG